MLFKLSHTKCGWTGLNIPTLQNKESLAELYKDDYKCIPANDRFELLCLTSGQLIAFNLKLGTTDSQGFLFVIHCAPPSTTTNQ